MKTPSEYAALAEDAIATSTTDYDPNRHVATAHVYATLALAAATNTPRSEPT